MKIDKPIYAVRVLTGEELTISELPLGATLRKALRTACTTFLIKTNIDDTELLDATQELAINERIAISQYLTGLKIQNFANNAAINDTITLEKEVNDFLKQYNKLTK